MALPAPLRMLLRDAALVGTALALLATSHRLGSAAPGSVALAAVAGIAMTFTGYLAHEWGHLLGALASRSVVHWPASAASPFLFRFDTGLNDRRQFLWMSAGGFVASAAVVAVFALSLSLQQLADRIALALTGLGALATVVLEVPLAWRVLRGAGLPRQGAVFVATPRA